MQCDYFDAAVCRSCTLMGESYAAQVRDLQATVADTLAERVAPGNWDEPATGPESHFRNKAKLAVGGTRQAPTFGILDRGGHGVDLRDCGLYEPGLHQAVLQLAGFVTDRGLTPYDVPRRTGELKHLIVTHSPDGESMIRFVLRSPGQLGRIERALPELLAAVPGTRVVSVNLLPEHKAALEGDDEIFLTSEQTLTMRLNHITLHLRPRSFFQTNTAVAAQLYQQAQQWISEIEPVSVLDLFCGVGGFALHAATALGLDTPGFDTDSPASLLRPTQPASVRGVEVSEDAVASARLSAEQLPGRESLGAIQFEAGDATSALDDGRPADLVIVNPPRRGIGELAGALDRSNATHVLYSSCNATSLAADLARMPSLRVTRARLFDMFPQTRHHEVLLLLER
jgi:SAM-dependent methyltransferases related to tRNA (uracil-5-)-methyltransferase